MSDEAKEILSRSLVHQIERLRAQLDEACEALEEAETVMSWMLLEGVDEVIHETCPKEYERFVFAHAFVAALVEKIKGGGDEG